jgi:hypothetical protein
MSSFSSRFALFMGLMLFLGSAICGVFEVKRVEAAFGTIYIRADGSIDPSDAPIARADTFLNSWLHFPNSTGTS